MNLSTHKTRLAVAAALAILVVIVVGLAISRLVSVHPSGTAVPTPPAATPQTPVSAIAAPASAVPGTRLTATPVSTPLTARAAALAPVDPVLLGTCAAAIHDRYVVTGPDGKLYRTWHPLVVPIDPSNPSVGTCTFAHDHGDDPSVSLANPGLPAFGYVGSLAGLSEPHEGFKVFVINQGAINDEGGVAQNSTRVVAHMGTGGPNRFDTRFHSLSFDLVAPDGHYVHVQGLADTSGVGSICASPRQGKTVVTLPNTGCSVTSLYEIWNMQFSVGDSAGPKVTVMAAPAVFDPITLMNPTDPPGHRALYETANYFSGGPFFGCNREEYSGPVYWYNASGPTTYYTDVFGNVVENGPLLQQISASSDMGVRMSSTNPFQMKYHKNQCAPGLGVKN